jgi:hypothetical protein
MLWKSGADCNLAVRKELKKEEMQRNKSIRDMTKPPMAYILCFCSSFVMLIFYFRVLVIFLPAQGQVKPTRGADEVQVRACCLYSSKYMPRSMGRARGAQAHIRQWSHRHCDVESIPIGLALNRFSWCTCFRN